MTIVLPREDPTLGGQRELLELERACFEAELGVPVAFATADPRRRAALAARRRLGPVRVDDERDHVLEAAERLV